MASVVTLWLYGWLYYPFYTQVAFLSTTVVEMALRERLPKRLDKTGRDRRGLSNLLQSATKAGLLRDDGFPSLKHRHEHASLAEVCTTQDETRARLPESSYVDVVRTWLPKVRNSFAHPNAPAISMPGQVVDSLILTAEIVNQLWPAPDA